MDLLTQPEHEGKTKIKNIQKANNILELEAPNTINDSTDDSSSEHVSSQEHSNENSSGSRESMGDPDVRDHFAITLPMKNELEGKGKFHNKSRIFL